MRVFVRDIQDLIFFSLIMFFSNVFCDLSKPYIKPYVNGIIPININIDTKTAIIIAAYIWWFQGYYFFKFYRGNTCLKCGGDLPCTSQSNLSKDTNACESV